MFKLFVPALCAAAPAFAHDLIAVTPSRVTQISASDRKVLLTCRADSANPLPVSERLEGAPERLSLDCVPQQLAVHPATGRWMVGFGVTGAEEVFLDGRAVSTSRNSVLAQGDRQGLRGWSIGNRTCSDGSPRCFEQPMLFLDADHVLVAEVRREERKWTFGTWSYGATPNRKPTALARDAHPLGHATGDGRVAVRVDAGYGLTAWPLDARNAVTALQLPPGGKGPMVVGDDVLFFEPGFCTEQLAGTYERMNVVSKKRTVIFTGPSCDIGGGRVFHRRGLSSDVLFVAGGGDRPGTLIAVDLASNQARPVAEGVLAILDVSSDGTEVAVSTPSGFQVLETEEWTVRLKGPESIFFAAFVD